MAHGGLAQAGKVKGRTPKVDKALKKKKLTGRAHKRRQYNALMQRIATKQRHGPNKNVK